MSRTNKEILDIFGEYDKVVVVVSEKISMGETVGSMEWFFYREDYDEITEEMEEVFEGYDTISICINWNLHID